MSRGSRSTTAAARAALAAAALGFALALAAGSAFAGRNCEARKPTPASIVSGMGLAERTAAALDQSGARVVVLARAGQNLSAYGLRWSHLGFAYRAEPGQPWRVVHKLNQCGTSRASLYRQGLGEFFLDDPWRYEAAFVVLAPDVQEHLLPALASNARVGALDTPAYSMVAYPWATRYQQSNQWAIETLAAQENAAAGTREGAQAWLRLRGYEPTTLRVNALERLGAQVGSANIAFDDHPPGKRFDGRIETVTVDSVLTWLGRSGLGGAAQSIR